MASENSNLLIGRGQPGTGVKVVLYSSAYTALMRVVRIETPSEVLGVLLGVRERSAGGQEHEQDSSAEARKGSQRGNGAAAEGDWIIIKEAVPVALVAEASGPIPNKREWEDLQARLSSDKGLGVVGWFYADPAMELSRSRFDVWEAQQALAPDAPLLLVVNPTESSGGFYRRQSGTLEPLTGFYEALPHKNAEPVIPWSTEVWGVSKWAGIPLSPLAVDDLPEPEVPARDEDGGGGASPLSTEAATRDIDGQASAVGAGAAGVVGTQAYPRTQVSNAAAVTSGLPAVQVAGYGELDGLSERVQRAAIAGSVLALILTVALFIFMIAPVSRPSKGQAASPTQVTGVLTTSLQAAIAFEPTGTPTITATPTERATSTGTATATFTVTATPTQPPSPTASPPPPAATITLVAPVVPPAPAIAPSATRTATQRPARPATSTPRRVPTRRPATRTPVRPTSTPVSPVNQPTDTPLPATSTPVPTLASTPIRPTATTVPLGSTNTPVPPVATDTPVPPAPTNTFTPSPANTVRPTRTSGPTDTPAPTNTPVPTDTAQPTDTPMPTNTRSPIDTPRPTNTVQMPRR